ncbi:MAG: dihydroorotase [Deltaproteobacteria bacterium]
MTDLLLRNGRIIDPANGLDGPGDILVRNGRIEAVGHGIPAPDACLLLDVTGKWVTPGLVDLHVHLREPGEEYKETIESGTRAAVAGGFTAVAAMPNTLPPNDSAAVTRFILERARDAGNARVHPVAAITRGRAGKELTEFDDLLRAGAVAFSDDGSPVQDAGLMRIALEYAQGLDALIISHAEEPALSEGGCVNEGRISTLLGLKGIPWAAEDIAVFRDVALAELTGARLHIAHVSTRGAVEIIRRAKGRGVRVSAETAPHYFSLTEEAVLDFDTRAKMNPPLRTEEDRQAIIEGLADGTLDVIATDHAPHSSLEKDVEFPLAASGIIGLETAFPLSLALVRAGRLDPAHIIRLLSTTPAQILRIPGGTLSPGDRADIAVFDPERSFEVTPENLCSKSHNTPFLGTTLTGRAVLTLVGGRIVHNLLGVGG